MIKLYDVELVYPSIFEKRQNPFSEKLMYRTAFKYEGDELKNNNVYRKGEEGLYNSTSIIKTTIRPKGEQSKGAYYALIDALEIARTCNMPVDFLMRGMIVDAVVDVYNYDHNGGGTGVVLKEIFVDVDELMSCVITSETGEVE